MGFAVDEHGNNLYIVFMEFLEACRLSEGPERTTALVAWVQGLFGKEEAAPVLVGGGAVEILTGGAYTTGDLDFVGLVPEAVARAFRENGFEKVGRHWINEEAQIFLEFPGDSLDPKERFIKYNAYGCDVVLISIEDLLVDRLGAWEYWKSGVDGANAFELYRSWRSRIDKGRLERRIKEEGFESALNALREFTTRWSLEDPASKDLEEWANRGPMPEKR